MTLDKKCRPNKLKNMIGNVATIQNLRVMIKKKDWPSTILLTGDTGCGKTTIARILSCERQSELIELNISNTRGIDQARNIIEIAKIHSLQKNGKTIILNECHQATKDFQDAILETLEEPPKGVMFILCTTDPQKLLPAVKSRCFVYHLNRLNHNESKELLKNIIKKENLKIDQSFFRDIISASNGIPRKLLLILDAISHSKSKTKIKRIISGYGYVDEFVKQETIELCRMLLKKESFNNVMNVLKTIEEQPETIRRVICSYMGKVLLSGKLNPNAVSILDYFEKYTELGMTSIIHSISNYYYIG